MVDRLRARSRLAVALLVLTLIPFGWVSLVSFSRFDRSVRERILSWDRNFASRVASDINQWFSRQVREIRFLKTTGNIHGSLMRLRDLGWNTDSSDWHEIRDRAVEPFAKSLLATYFYRSVFITDPEGTVIYSTEEGTIGQSLVREEFFHSARQGRITYSSPFFSDDLGLRVIVLLAPVQSEMDHGEFLGAFGLVMAWEAVDQMVLAGIGELGSTADAYLVAGDGTLLTAPRNQPDLSHAILAQKVSSAAVDRLYEAIANRNLDYSFHGQYRSPWAASVLGYLNIVNLGSVPAGLIVEVNASEAFADLNRLRLQVIVAGFVFSGIVIGLGLYLGAPDPSPLVKTAGLLFERTPNPILVTDETGSFVDANTAALEFLRATKNELLGRSVYDYQAATGDEPQKAGEDWTGEQTYVIEGEERTLIMSSMPVDVRGSRLILGLGTDITELKRVKDQLHKDRESLSAMLHSIGDAVIAVDAEGAVTLMNPVAEGLSGWTMKQALGVGIDTVLRTVNKKTLEVIPNPVHRVLATGQLATMEADTVVVSRTGKACPVADSASPVRNSKGEIVGAILVFRDITEQEQQEARQRLGFKTLELLNRSEDRRELMFSMLTEIKAYVRCEACAIRLQQGDGGSLFSAIGFVPGFVDVEGGVCLFDALTKSDHDCQNHGYSCICSAVLGGDADRSEAGWTRAGSFWTESSSMGQSRICRWLTPIRESGVKAGYEGLAIIPLRSSTGIAGTLHLVSRTPGTITRGKVEYIEKIGESIGAGLARLKAEENLRYMSHYDRLTGLYNRMRFDSELAREVAENELPVSVVVTDIIGLKAYNDSEGHEAGDRIIRLAASAFRLCMPGPAVTSRVGGDEFAAIIPRMCEEDAQAAAFRLRDSFAEAVIGAKSIDIAIGYAETRTPGRSLHKAYSEAEDRMIKDKHRSG